MSADSAASTTAPVVDKKEETAFPEEHICACAVIVRIVGGCPQKVLDNVRTCTENGTTFKAVPVSCIVGLPVEVLMLKRKKGHWECPKGHVELHLGEDERACSLREMSEEAGMHPEHTAFVDGFCHKFTYQNRDAAHCKTVTWYLFLVLSETHETQHDHPSLIERHFFGHKWLDFDEALSMAFHKHTGSILTLAKQYLTTGKQ